MTLTRRLACFFLAIAPVQGQSEPLGDAVRAALTTNPAIMAANAETRANAYELLKLQSEYQPVVSAFGEAGAQRVDDPASLNAADNGRTRFTREIGLEAELLLFDGHRRANLVYANAARVDGSIFRLLDASETMALNATEVYIDVARHLRLQEVGARNLARHRAIGAQVRDLVDAGRLPLSDRLQVEDRIRAAQLALIEVQRAGRDAEARYERIIGKRRKGAMSIPGVRDLPRSMTALVTAAVDNSYRVRVANIEIERAGYEKGAAEADRMPRVTLNAGVRRGVDIDGVAGAESDAFIGVRMRWILHQGGRKAQSRALAERKSKAISERNVAIREVREMAERTWNSYIANAERLRILNAQLSANQALVTQFQSEFDAGTRTMLDVLEVERARFDVEFEKVSADAALAFSSYRLLAAQSRLAHHFGAVASGSALIPDFQDRARARPASVFKTEIRPLE